MRLLKIELLLYVFASDIRDKLQILPNVKCISTEDELIRFEN